MGMLARITHLNEFKKLALFSGRLFRAALHDLPRLQTMHCRAFSGGWGATGDPLAKKFFKENYTCLRRKDADLDSIA